MSYMPRWNMHCCSLLGSIRYKVMSRKVHRPHDTRHVCWQVFFPLLPGVESIYEPAMESAEEVVDDLKENVDQALDSFRK